MLLFSPKFKRDFIHSFILFISLHMWSPIILLTRWFCYCSINQHFSMHLLSRCSGAFRLKISASKLELDPWILGAEIITANDFFCQPKLHLGWKGMKSSSNPCTVLQLEEISLARLQRVGVMKFSFSGWTQLCLSQLLWNDWKIKTGFVWSETVQIWSNCLRGKKSLLARSCCNVHDYDFNLVDWRL